MKGLTKIISKGYLSDYHSVSRNNLESFSGQPAPHKLLLIGLDWLQLYGITFTELIKKTFSFFSSLLIL